MGVPFSLKLLSKPDPERAASCAILSSISDIYQLWRVRAKVESVRLRINGKPKALQEAGVSQEVPKMPIGGNKHASIDVQRLALLGKQTYDHALDCALKRAIGGSQSDFFALIERQS